jgi:hypothetical protein
MFDNVSNDLSANIFEASTGVINCAPIKISGQWKIVIDTELNLWFDDYNNRRVSINVNAPFMPQVSAFLKTPTVLKDATKLFYGGYSYATNMSWHCPLYLGTDNVLPTHFVISRVPNQQITEPAVLQNTASIISLVDLELCGVNGLLRQMQSTAQTDYPVQLNWNAAEMLLFGYSIAGNSLLQQTVSLLDSQANQTTVAVVNNMVLNSFKQNGLIFPRFVNIECEYVYVDNKNHFNNFYGYLSNAVQIPLSSFVIATVSARLQLQAASMSWVQQLGISQQLQQYDVVVGSATVIAIDEQQAQLRVLVNRLQVNDSFTIRHPDNSIYFQYVVTTGDIKPTLLETLKQLCIRMSTLSNRFLLFTCTTSFVITIIANIEDDLIEEYNILPSGTFSFIDNGQTNFRQITENDIRLGNSETVADIETFGSLKINSVDYPIIDAFEFNGNSIIRLGTKPVFNGYTIAFIIDNRTETLVQLPPIPWLTPNSTFNALPQYDMNAYVAELTEKFVTDSVEDPELIEASQTAIEGFDNNNTAIDVVPYVEMDDMGNFESKPTVDYDATLNENGILFMGFNTPGSTSFLTPNMFNLDMQYWDKNGNPDSKLLKLDPLRFHWFLVKGETPEYVSGDVRSLRYFTDTPKIGARLIPNGTLWSGENFCETVFLGVRYQLPQKYSGYLFSVYLDPNDVTQAGAADVSYNFEIDDVNMLLRLRIAKYLDFSDLIRGASSDNPAFLDFGLLYSVTESYNTKSTVVSGFNSGGVILADNTLTTLFNGTVTTDYKFQDIDGQWYICLKRSLDIVTTPFNELFLPAGDAPFSVFQTITIDGTTYEYVAIDFKIVGIHQVAADYLWCKDLQATFFDTQQIFINKYGTDSDSIFQIDKDNVLSESDAGTGIYGDENIIATILVDGQNQQFKLLNYNKTFSFIVDWFELTRNVSYSNNHTIPPITTDGFFVFPEFSQPSWGITELKTRFLENSFDAVTSVQRVTLFDRNNIWKMLKDVMVVEAKFKGSTSAQIVNSLADLLVSQLQDQANLQAIPATGGNDSFINLVVVDNDVNLVIWQTGIAGSLTPKLHAINRYRGPHMPYLRKLANELLFQADIANRPQTSIQSIFDPNFGGPGINATGLWTEVTGNVVSSLFSMSQTISITVPFGTLFDIRQLLSTFITVDEATILSNNAAFITKINANINSYILSAYIDWLLLNEYSLTLVQNEINQKIAFTADTKNAYLVNIQPMNTYQTRFTTLTFNFNRK